MGKYVDRALDAAGATRVLPLGKGNDQKDLEEDFEKWKDEVFWPGMKRRYLKDGAIAAAWITKLLNNSNKSSTMNTK